MAAKLVEARGEEPRGDELLESQIQVRQGPLETGHRPRLDHGGVVKARLGKLREERISCMGLIRGF